MYRPALIVGAIFAMLAVVLGAFGAHSLKPVLTEAQLQTFETGVRYQFYHSFALLVVGITYQYLPFRLVKLAGLLFTIGILLFSGSLYIITALKMNGSVGLKSFGIITPIGGLFFIAGWVTLIIGFFKKK
ncbi:MAG: DUF423 domain-containing protein [Flavipsychrobacter sp.]